MRALHPIVLGLGPHMGGRKAKLARRGGIGAEPVGHQRLRGHSLLLEQLSHQPESRALAPPGLDQHVEDLALAVDGAPEIQPPTADRDEHLIEVPAAARPAALRTKPAGNRRAEAGDPGPDRLVADGDAPLRQQLLDVAQAEREPGVEPDGVLDDDPGKAEPAADNGAHAGSLPATIRVGNPPNLTSPSPSAPISAASASRAASVLGRR